MKVWIHDTAKALKESHGQPVTLVYQDGSKHVLLTNGQRINVDPGQGGKKGRRDRIKARRLAREQAPATANP